MHASTAAATRRGFLGLGAGLAASSAVLACRAESTAAPLAPEREAELDELFAHLTDQTDALAPIGADEHRARRARLGELLARRGLDALLCEGGPTMRYLSGVSWGRSERLFALVVLADGSSLWVSPAFEEDRARLSIDGDAGPGGEIVTWEEHEYAWRPLAAALAARRVERVALEPSTRVFVREGLAAEHGEARVASGTELLVELRGRKDEHELALLRQANVLTQRALAAVGEALRPGLDGRAIAEMVRHAQVRLGLRDVWVLALLGPDAALPHGGANTGTLAPGEVVLIDTGGAYHAYQSDETRSWVFGAPPDAFQERVWNAVRDAQRRAFETIRPGVRCRDVDAAARASLERAGFGPGYAYLTHRLGHGIGMEGHEAPYFDGGSEVVLVPGMTFSDEPGVYLRGRFGMRIEDIVAVTEDGADHFGDWQRGPGSPA